MEKERIIDKVKKLLALTESDNVNEAESAMLMAQKLLAKYNLEISDIEVNVDNKVIEQNIFETSKMWVCVLAKVVSKNFRCDSFFRGATGRKTKSVVFVGAKSDIELANEIFTYALAVAKVGIKNEKQKYKKIGISVAGVENDYGVGFAAGLKKKFEMQLIEQNKVNENYGLMVLTPEAVTNHMNSLNVNARKVKHYASSSYSQGYTDGKRFSKNTITA